MLVIDDRDDISPDVYSEEDVKGVVSAIPIEPSVSDRVEACPEDRVETLLLLVSSLNRAGESIALMSSAIARASRERLRVTAGGGGSGNTSDEWLFNLTTCVGFLPRLNRGCNETGMEMLGSVGVTKTARGSTAL